MNFEVNVSTASSSLQAAGFPDINKESFWKAIGS